ncbi:Cyanovirin-N [Mycena sanguinolenta]|nr:Cyanovirin-N [Mycena sanguinolenta]
MKINIISYATAILLHTFSTQAESQAGDFSATCSNINLAGLTLTAICGDGAGGFKDTSIDLNDCIINSGGTLLCQANGNFGFSCDEPFFSGGVDLAAFCGPDGAIASIDLDECVGNFGGNLGSSSEMDRTAADTVSLRLCPDTIYKSFPQRKFWILAHPIPASSFLPKLIRHTTLIARSP